MDQSTDHADKPKEDVLDLDTYVDLGLFGCGGFCRPPSTWIPEHTTRRYLTEVIPAEIRRMILSYAVISGEGTQPIKADVITGGVFLYHAGDYDFELDEAEEESMHEDGTYHLDASRPRKNTWYGISSYSTKLYTNPTLQAYATFVKLSLTCKLLNAETKSLFFGENRFSFHDILGMELYLGGLTLEQRSLLSQVIFVQSTKDSIDDLRWAFDLLSECPLQKLTIGIHHNGLIMMDGFRVLLESSDIGYIGRLKGWRNVRIKVVEALSWCHDELKWLPAPLIPAKCIMNEEKAMRELKEWERYLQCNLSGDNYDRQDHAMSTKYVGENASSNSTQTRGYLRRNHGGMTDLMDNMNSCGARCKELQRPILQCFKKRYKFLEAMDEFIGRF